MNWPNASFAGWIRRSSCAAQGFIQAFRTTSGAGSAIARPTKPMPRPSSPPQLEESLHRRAIRICNREPKAVARYMATHQSLAKGF